MSGTAVITVTLTDAGEDLDLLTPGDNGTFSRTFTVTVDPVNDAPTIAGIADPAAINEDAADRRESQRHHRRHQRGAGAHR